MQQRHLFLVMTLCATVGLAISLYSYLHHFSVVSGAVCTINDTFNCDIVNRGPYSVMFGIPVALMGVVGYGLMLLATILRWRQPNDKMLDLFLVLSTAGGLAFALYLTGIEAFVLRAWCLLCLTSQMSILVLFVCTLLLYRSRKNFV